MKRPSRPLITAVPCLGRAPQASNASRRPLCRRRPGNRAPHRTAPVAELDCCSVTSPSRKTRRAKRCLAFDLGYRPHDRGVGRRYFSAIFVEAASVRTRYIPDEPAMALQLVPATAADRARIARIRGPVGMGRFVHRNWFWLDRALADPAIRFVLIRGGARGGITGCLAYGPHERIDLDPCSRMPRVGEIYHLVIDRNHTGRGGV
jgi:hypothetical protein